MKTSTTLRVLGDLGANPSLTSSRIDPRFVDVKPVRGTMTVEESERIMRKHGFDIA